MARKRLWTLLEGQGRVERSRGVSSLIAERLPQGEKKDLRMKEVALSELKDDLSSFLRQAENEEIVITRHGKPAGLLVGFRSEEDWIAYRLQKDPRFLVSEERRASLDAWRRDRIEKIRVGDGIPKMAAGPKLVVQIVPLLSLSHQVTVSPADISRDVVHEYFQPLGNEATGLGGRPNYDGYLVDFQSEGASHGYCQLFRDGRVESVGTWRVPRNAPGPAEIPSLVFEGDVVRATERHVEGLHAVGVQGPYFILVSLCNVLDVRFAVRRQQRNLVRPFDRDVLLLPEVTLQGNEDKLAVQRALEPAIIVAWNAAGFPTSPYAGAHGPRSNANAS